MKWTLAESVDSIWINAIANVELNKPGVKSVPILLYHNNMFGDMIFI